MAGKATSHSANISLWRPGEQEQKEPLQSICNLFGGIICWGGINEFHDEVCHPWCICPSEAVHNLGDAWCAWIVDCHTEDILLRLTLEFQRVTGAVLDKVRLVDYTESVFFFLVSSWVLQSEMIACWLLMLRGSISRLTGRKVSRKNQA